MSAYACGTCGSRAMVVTSLVVGGGWKVSCANGHFVPPDGATTITFDPRPEDAAPPVRELPTEPGAVVLGSTVNAVAPRVMVLGHAGPSGAAGWLEWTYVDDDGDPASTETPDDDWRPATVVPTAAHEAAVKALRDVVALLDGPQSGDAQEAQDAAINALADIEGWAGL